MKIAFITTMYSAPWGGSEELWQRTAIRMREEGHDVMASVQFWENMSEKVTCLEGRGVKLQIRYPSYPKQLSRRIWNKISRKRLRYRVELKRFQPDLVIISQGHNAGGFEWAKICQEADLPYVMIVHCNSEDWWFGNELNAALAGYGQAKKIFCVSQGNLDLLRMQLGEQLPHAEIVWNPCNVSREAPPAWPSYTGGWRMACVARMEPAGKGHDVLFRTMALPEWRGRKVEVNLYGSGPDEPGLRRYAEMLKLENVVFRGHVQNVRSIWEENHLLVLPSRHEGLPLALVEAMWCGRPAMVTNVGGNAELCLDELTGFVAPAPIVSSISETLTRAWARREDWPSMGEAGRRRVENLVPSDPIGVFCDRLKAIAGKVHPV